MVMLKDQMYSGVPNKMFQQRFSNEPTMFAGGTPTRLNDPRTAIAAAQPTTAGTGFNTTLPTQAPVAAPATVGLTGIPSAPSSVGAGEVALGGVLGGLLGGGIDLQNVLGTAGQAYLGQEAISAPYEVGRAGLEMAEQVGQRGAETAAFKPYTVTSNLARVGTDPSGGFTTQLSPEQQALQNQIMGQAGGFFSQLQADPAAVQAGIYEDIRATQRPEEERQRLALEERMLSQGRLGLSPAAYGGASPELLAMETARQEAMARANVGARQQALAEQQQAAGIAGGLLGAGYMPQQQALDLLQASQIPAGFADIGRRSGAQFQQQAGLAGIESLLQGSQTAEINRGIQLQNLLNSVAGRQDPTTGSFGGGLLSSILGGRESTQDMLTLPTTATDSFLGGSDFLSSIFLPEVTNPYDTGSLFSGYVPPAIPSPGQQINLGNIQAPDDFGYQL